MPQVCLFFQKRGGEPVLVRAKIFIALFVTKFLTGQAIPLYYFSRAKNTYSGLAQLVEHLTVNQVVVSSSLTTGVLKRRVEQSGGAFFVQKVAGPSQLMGPRLFNIYTEKMDC